MKNVTIIGAGAWGTALAYIFRGTGLRILIWSKNPSIVADINQHKKNKKYTGDNILTDIRATTNLRTSLSDADVVINALPSYAIRDVFESAKQNIKENTIIINASKGLDTSTHQLPYQVFREILPPKIHYFSLSGPGFASGVLNGHPTTINIAGKDHNLIKEIKSLARTNNVFLSYSSDVIGVEWGGIYKNIVAIAAGLSSGLGYGENTNALVFSAGFKEMVQSGITLGGNLETFYEPCGVGDLMLSTSSMKSRNYSFGYYLTQEKKIETVFTKLSGVAEGYYALKSIAYLKNKHALTLPLSIMLHEIIFAKADHKNAFMKFLETHFE